MMVKLVLVLLIFDTVSNCFPLLVMRLIGYNMVMGKHCHHPLIYSLVDIFGGGSNYVNFL